MEIPVGVVPRSVVDERVDPSCRVHGDASELAGTTDFTHTISYVPGRLLRRRGQDVVAIRHDAIFADCALSCKVTSCTPPGRTVLMTPTHLPALIRAPCGT